MVLARQYFSVAKANGLIKQISYAKSDFYRCLPNPAKDYLFYYEGMRTCLHLVSFHRNGFCWLEILIKRT